MKIEFRRYSGYESPHDYDSFHFILNHGEETGYCFRMEILVYRGRYTAELDGKSVSKPFGKMDSLVRDLQRIYP